MDFINTIIERNKIMYLVTLMKQVIETQLSDQAIRVKFIKIS